MKLPEERLEIKGGMASGGPVLRKGVGGDGPASLQEGEAGGGPVIEESEAVKKLLGQLLT